jgi:hypothetical protein
MQRLCAALVCCAVVQLAAPARADAWIDWLEHWSGPGPFIGWDIEARLACIVGPDGSSLQAIMTEVGRRLGQIPGTEALRKQAGSIVSAAESDVDLPARLGRLRSIIVAARPVAPDQPGQDDQWRDVLDALSAAQRLAGGEQGNRLSASLGGVIASACSVRQFERSRAWISLGFRFMRTDEDDRFAGGERIQFTTIEPAMTFRVFGDKPWSFIDYGFGAGAYWVSSRGFRSHNGAFLEPVRLDFHVPRTETRNRWRRVLESAVLRTGVLVFPAGFEPDAFVGTSPTRIPRDWVKTVGIYVDATEWFD